jgi:hypothetical protein
MKSSAEGTDIDAAFRNGIYQPIGDYLKVLTKCKDLKAG